VQYDDNLIIDSAKNAASLERKFKKLLHEFHGVDTKTIEFEHAYDITALFAKFGYLKITSIAKKAKINPALLRQYASGVKYPSPRQAKKLEDAIHEIGKELTDVAVYAR
jgi:hypothetical protein